MKKLLNINFDLYEYLTVKIIERFEKHLEFTGIQRDKLYFGVISVLINIIKTAVIFWVAILLGIINEILIMTIVVAMLRLTASGLHAKSNLMCTLTTLVTYIGGVYISIYFPVRFGIAFAVGIVLTAILYKYAPADTENRPILGKEKRRKLKVKTLIIALVFLIINLLIWNTRLMNLTMIAMLFQAIAILPCTYKLLKRRCRNYEKYETN